MAGGGHKKYVPQDNIIRRIEEAKNAINKLDEDFERSLGLLRALVKMHKKNNNTQEADRVALDIPKLIEEVNTKKKLHRDRITELELALTKM